MLRSKRSQEQVRRKPLNIRTGDNVLIIAGEARGDTVRKVLAVLPREGKVVVEGVNVMKDRLKGRGAGRQAGINDQDIIEKACPIDRSNVALVDPKTKKPTRVKVVTGPDGKRMRVAGKSGEAI